MTKTTLYLTRHGETEWNVEGKLQGHKDSPLTILGKRQARWLGESLKEIDFNAIYSSASQRACHTADIIRWKRQLDISPCDSLMEINMGSWEGKKRLDIETIFPNEYKSFWNTPDLYNPANGGESFYQLQDRLIPKVKEIISEHKGGNVLIVTHAIALKVMMAYFSGVSLEKLWSPPVMQPTALNRIVIDNTEFNIELHGDISHYRTVRNAVGAIAYQGNKILLVHKVLHAFGKPSGVWDFPKGGVEEGDLSLADAVIRELVEETGTNKYVIKQELPEKLTFEFNEEIRKQIGYERQETTMFLVEFIGNPNDVKPIDKEIEQIMFVESENLLKKLSHEETVAYVQRHCHLLGKGTR